MGFPCHNKCITPVEEDITMKLAETAISDFCNHSPISMTVLTEAPLPVSAMLSAYLNSAVRQLYPSLLSTFS
jgi:hypothetical protein